MLCLSNLMWLQNPFLVGGATQGTSIPQKPFCKAPGQSVFHGGGEVVEHIQWLADSRNLGS